MIITDNIRQRNMNRYQHSKIYKLVNDVDNRIYVGSTCTTLTKRKNQHKYKSNKYPNRHVYQHFFFKTKGWDNVRIILIENVECENKDQLRAREQHWIDTLNPSLNKNSAIDNCPHGRRQALCVDCNGSCICEHNRQRSHCKVCGGSQICRHNRRRNICKDCNGSSICEHNRIRHACKECGGSQICEHNRQKQRCKDCLGDKYYCYECESNFCSNRILKRHLRSKKHKKRYKQVFLEVFNETIEDDEIPE